MLLFRLLALIFAMAAVIAGAIQLADRLTGRSEALTVIGLWQRASPASLAATAAALGPNHLWDRLVSPLLAVPAWILCMGLALLCWAVSAFRTH
jgi:hypothetical protein